MTGQVFGTVAEGSTTQQTEAETSKASFSLRGHNPDVLTCIANLSNDEVFTPPELANEMLDVLEEAWAESNAGANIWADPSVTFLDPFTKSGVFLREIVTRLTNGLEHAFPDLQQRVDHILTKQVFGIGITQLTTLLARRTVYCSKFANGKHSITDQFDDEAGNIWFERTEHTWTKRKREQRVHPTSGITEMVELEGTGRCKFCGANEANYSRDSQLETHAYAFIHTDDIKARMAELFGANMQFDVIIGNPPYQLSDGGAGASSLPIYDKFVDTAKKLDPRFLIMIIPSRWFAGGRGLAQFRESMLTDGRVRSLSDFLDSRTVFPGVDVAGGVCYFLWDRNTAGPCKVTTVGTNNRKSTTIRPLLEPGADVFVRHNEGISILRKVWPEGFYQAEQSNKLFRQNVSGQKPFGLRTYFRGTPTPNSEDDIQVLQSGGRGWTSRASIPEGRELLDRWKVFTSKSSSEHAGQSDKEGRRRVLSLTGVLPPGTAVTETYVLLGTFDSEREARNCLSYVTTRFFRFLILLRSSAQDISRAAYSFIPLIDFSKAWTDEELYDKYGLTDEEIAFIESQIKPMELSDE